MLNGVCVWYEGEECPVTRQHAVKCMGLTAQHRLVQVCVWEGEGEGEGEGLCVDRAHTHTQHTMLLLTSSPSNTHTQCFC